METSNPSLDLPKMEPAINGYHPAQPSNQDLHTGEAQELHREEVELLSPGSSNWPDPAFPQQLLRNLEDFSGAFRASVSEQSKLKSELHYTGQQMSQVFGAMSQLLDMMYEKMVHPPASPAGQEQLPQSISLNVEDLGPLTNSICDSVDHGFGQLEDRVHLSEERQLAALQATLQQLQLDREVTSTSFLTQVESMRTQTRIEFNRLLQALLLGTAVAAAGAGAAFLYLRH